MVIWPFVFFLSFKTLNLQTEDAKKNLTFVPLAPACVVSSFFYLHFMWIFSFEDLNLFICGNIYATSTKFIPLLGL